MFKKTTGKSEFILNFAYALYSNSEQPIMAVEVQVARARAHTHMHAHTCTHTCTCTHTHTHIHTHTCTHTHMHTCAHMHVLSNLTQTSTGRQPALLVQCLFPSISQELLQVSLLYQTFLVLLKRKEKTVNIHRVSHTHCRLC